MPRVIITFQDNEDGTVSINVESDESLPMEKGKFPEDLRSLTNAQRAAVLAMEYIFEIVEGVDTPEETDAPEHYTVH